MIDVISGEIRFSSPSAQFGPRSELAQFEAGEFFRDARLVVNMEPLLGWQIMRSLSSGSLGFALQLMFDGQRLSSIYLCNDDPALGESDARWPTDGTGARHRSHEAWLESTLGADRTFPWGTVRAEYASTEGWSAIKVDYRE